MRWSPKTYDMMRTEAQERIAERMARPLPAPSILPAAPLSPLPAITLGHFENGQALDWPILKMAPRHMLATGSTGSGKTNLMTHFERQFVLAGGGLLSVDPDGAHPASKFNNQLQWIDQTEIYKHRRVEVLDLNDAERLIPFNAVAPIPGVHPTVIADETSVAFQRIDGADWKEKPLLEAIMVDLLTIAAMLSWTICELRLLLDPDDAQGVRRWAIDHINDDYLRSTLERLNQAALAEKSKRDFRAMVQGPLNRLSDIERFEKTRLIVGAGPRFDLARAMDENAIITVDASSGNDVGDTAARTFTSLLTRSAFSTMRQRRHPERLFLYSVDEAPAVIKGQQDTEELVARARKYGVCIFFGMQYLRQATPEQYQALKNCSNTRLTFRTVDHKEAEEHVLDLVPLDLERPKESMIRPTQIGVTRTTLHSRSRSQHEAKGHSEATTESFSEAESSTAAYGESQASSSSSFDAQGLAESASAGQVLTPPGGTPTTPLSQSIGTALSENSISGMGTSEMSGSMSMTATSRASSRGEARSQGTSSSAGTSEATGEADAFEPLFRDLPAQLFSLEESIHQAARTLKTLEPGEAIVAFGSMSAKIKVPLIPSVHLSSEQAAALRRRFIDASPSSMLITDARAALQARKGRILATAKQHSNPPRTITEPDFSPAPLPIVDNPIGFAKTFVAQRGSQLPDPPEPKKRPGRKPIARANKDKLDLRVIDGGKDEGGDKPKDD